MPDEVTIQTGSRLHFGLLSCGNPALPQFGGIGMMIDRPGFRVRATVASEDRFVGPDEFRQRVMELIGICRRHWGPQALPPVCVEIRSEIPPHVGLGSGTQLALAVAKALATMAGERDLSAPVLARRVGRGARSAIGIYGFDQGGFLVEGGKRNESSISPLAVRKEVPSSWRVVLVRPLEAQGVSGVDEKSSFSRLPPMPESTTNRLCRIVLMEMLPAISSADFLRFSMALFDFGSLVGDYFSPVQGGRFAHPQMQRLATTIRSRGFDGVAQTSWGPTICVLCRDEVSAMSLADELRSDPKWTDCRVDGAVPLNSGAG